MLGLQGSKLGDLQGFCRRNKVKTLSVFGSRARGDAGENSDIDLLIEFEDGSGISYLDMMTMRIELEEMLGCRVDLIEKAAMTNPIRMKRILSERIPLYGSSGDLSEHWSAV